MATDQELLAALRAGESAALETVISQYTAYVTAVIENQLGRNAARADIEELCADVFYILWQWRTRLKSDRLRGWLGTTARNIARDFLRKHRLYTVAAEDYLTVSYDSAQQLLEQAERHAVIQASLLELEPDNREIFLRYYFYNQSVSEISAILGLTPTAVKSRLLRGRKKLKEILLKGGFLSED